MHLVDGHGRFEVIAPIARGHPVLVAPLVVEAPDDGSGAWRMLVPEADRIGLIDAIAVMVGDDVVFVESALSHAGNKANPDARRALGVEPPAGLVPAVEVAHHENLLCARSPDGELRSGNAIANAQVRPEFFVKPIVVAFVEEIIILFAENSAIFGEGRREVGRE